MFRYYSEWLLLGFYLLFSGIVFAGVFLANKKGYQLIRPGRFDLIIKNNLKKLKIDNVLIKCSFGLIEMVLPVLIVSCVFIP
jgi:hypothetical protein